MARHVLFTSAGLSKRNYPIPTAYKRNKRIHSDQIVVEKVTYLQSNVELGVRGNAGEKEFHICISNLLDVEVYDCIINKCIWQ